MTQPDRPQYRGTLADWHQQAPDYMREISRQRYPMVAARFAAGPSDIEAASTARFAFALDCLVDDLETRRHR